MDEFNLTLASFLMRVILGILLFAQGYEKIFKIGIHEVENTVTDYEQSKLPSWLTNPIVLINSIIELVGGLLLILGLFKSYAIYAISFNFLIVAIGLSMNKSMWDMEHFFPRLFFLVMILILPSQYDQWSLDFILGFTK